MSTGNQNLDLLIKLLGQTTNENDHIALMAIRKANEQVAKFNTDWENLLRGRVTIVSDPFNSMEPPRGASVRSTQAPPMEASRRPPPRPQAPPPVQPQRPQPRPQATNAAGRGNRFRARCVKCGRSLDPYQGVLTDQSPITGNWRVECSPTLGHLASYKKPSGAAKKSTDNLMDIL